MIFGVDVSRWQGDIDWQRVKSDGAQFAIIKCTQGVSTKDPKFRENYIGALRAGLLVAAYHYISKASPKAQATFLRNALVQSDTPIMLDWELDGGTYGQYKTVYAECVAAGLNVVMSYIPRWYWEEQAKPEIKKDTMLISSRYPSTAQGTFQSLFANVTDKHWAPYGGKTPVILQFSDKCIVGGTLMDANAFAGTIQQLYHLWYHDTTEMELLDMTNSLIQIRDGKRRLAIALPPSNTYKRVTFCAAFSDAVLDNLWFIGAPNPKPHYLRNYVGFLIRQDMPETAELPSGTKQITIEYSGETPISWAFE